MKQLKNNKKIKNSQIIKKLRKIKKNNIFGIWGKHYFLKNSIDFTRPTVPVIITSPPGAA